MDGGREKGSCGLNIHRVTCLVCNVLNQPVGGWGSKRPGDC